MMRGDEPPLLTFQWRDRDRPLFRLVGYTLLTLAGTAGFFMLFKVVYPQARHFSTAPQQVLMLDPAQAATRTSSTAPVTKIFSCSVRTRSPSRRGGMMTLCFLFSVRVFRTLK